MLRSARRVLKYCNTRKYAHWKLQVEIVPAHGAKQLMAMCEGNGEDEVPEKSMYWCGAF